jgi:hypothetical protein
VRGIDYEEIFAPVLHTNTLRFLLGYVASHDYEVEKVDVQTAFLYERLDEEVYVRPPPEPEEQHTNFEVASWESRVWRLKKALYGLKQAPRVWQKRVLQFMISRRFEQSQGDPGLYLRRGDNENLTIVLIYVDDILIMAKTKGETEWFKQELRQEFAIRDMGEARWFLGILIQRDRSKRELSICQGKYTTSILETFGMMDCKPNSVPFRKQNAEDSEGKAIICPYRELIGATMYLATMTRPDIMWSVSYLSRFISNATNSHWMAAKGLLRYLKGTCNMGLKFGGDHTIQGYSDADWAGDTTSRKSTGGYVFTIGRTAFSWQSKLQSVVAASSTEAEYIAMAQAAREALWVRKIAAELKILPEGGVILKGDNMGALKLGKNNMTTARSKHIDIIYHFTRNYVEQELIKLEYVSTEDMVADMMTKALGPQKLHKCRLLCGMVDCSV